MQNGQPQKFLKSLQKVELLYSIPSSRCISHCLSCGNAVLNEVYTLIINHQKAQTNANGKLR
ncbi:hypothetical protein T11_2481 [Trichinella zimbabwensis]|uniref:Uncharacterized protein n=1 Tax=Trichinella zimbabwensis TaxID=268475 RepID=A0A0V1H2K2_9BILA|nr:hypothetical protein T11_17610 [Trichinella zimbabwensis]KRZ04754.1 hypothetical protein T11_2481 [Trichinella zimbabwensis]